MSERTFPTRLIVFISLVSITLGVYCPATHFSFLNYDDPDYVTLNAQIQRGLNRESVAWAFTTRHASNWHPLTWISHALDCSIFGPRAGGHHLTNILLHAANAGLLFLLLTQLTGITWRSALVAALFAWHPLHVESVAWISERKDVLSTFFWLLSLMAYASYAARSKNRNASAKTFYVLSLLFFCLGLLSKPMVVTLPFVLFLLDVWPLGRAQGRGTWARLILEKIPFFVLTLPVCCLTVWAQKSGNSVVSAIALPFSQRVSNALVSYVFYLWKTMWPTRLALPYPYFGDWTIAQSLGAAVLLALITVLVICAVRMRPWLAVGWFWFLGTLVPVIGLVQVGLQSMADRYTYVPIIGIFIMIVWTIPAAWARWPRPGLIFGTTITGMLVFLLAGTETQLQYWRSSVALFTNTVQETHDNILAEYNLAEALAREGDDESAIAHYQRALAITPNRVEARFNSQPQSRFNLGLLFRIHKRWAEAESQFRAFLRDEPFSARAHANLGVALVGLHRDGEGMAEFRLAAKANPADPDEVQALAMFDAALAEAGRFTEAMAAAQNTRNSAIVAKRDDLATAATTRMKSYQSGK